MYAFFVHVCTWRRQSCTNGRRASWWTSHSKNAVTVAVMSITWEFLFSLIRALVKAACLFYKVFRGAVTWGPQKAAKIRLGFLCSYLVYMTMWALFVVLGCDPYLLSGYVKTGAMKICSVQMHPINSWWVHVCWYRDHAHAHEKCVQIASQKEWTSQNNSTKAGGTDFSFVHNFNKT